MPYIVKPSSEDAKTELSITLLGKMLGITVPKIASMTYEETLHEDLTKLVPPPLGDWPVFLQKMNKYLGDTILIMEDAGGQDLEAVIKESEESTPQAAMTKRLENVEERNQFLADCGRVAAFDIVVGIEDRFHIKGQVSVINLGNLFMKASNQIVAIDNDLSSLQDIEHLRETFEPYLADLKGSKDLAVESVLLAFGEYGVDLTSFEKYREQIVTGIDATVTQVKRLTEPVIATMFADEENYVKYLTGVVEYLNS
jgi:hypothetical protein